MSMNFYFSKQDPELDFDESTVVIAEKIKASLKGTKKQDKLRKQREHFNQ